MRSRILSPGPFNDGRWAVRRALLAAMLVCASLPACLCGDRSPAAAADIPAAESSRPPIDYRRIFVPAEKVDAWPRDGQKYIPVESRDFDAWVAAANLAASARESSATIDTAEYTGRLDDIGSLHGHGQWNISVEGDSPAFLPLRRMSLVVRDPHWQNAPQEPVRLGFWGRDNAEPERRGFLVPRSGIVEFDWDTQSRALRDGVEIPWRLPTATTTRVTLDLPDDKRPIIEGGAVLDSNLLPTNDASTKPARRRWLLAIGPSSGTALHITNSGQELTKTNVATNDLAIREELNYRIAERGMDLTSTWQLEGAVNKQREFAVPLPRGLQLLSVVADGHDLKWRAVRGASPSSDTAMITLPSVGKSRSLQIVLSAWQPLVLERTWKLPSLRPDGVFWTSGKMEISIAPEFELRSLNAADCAQTSVSQIGAGKVGPETHSLLAYSPDSKLEVDIARRQPDAAIRLGSSLVLADPDVTGRLVTEWNVARSSLHRLSGELAAGWNVETVETIPSDAMAEWFIDRRGNHRHIEIQLSDAASPTHDISVIIVARLQRFSLAEPISADTLRMVNWSAARVDRHFLTFQSTEPFDVESVGELPIVDRDSISDRDRALLDAGTGDIRIIDLTRAGNDAGLQLTFKRGQYDADVDVDASYSNQELRQVFRITARPRTNPIDRLLVYSTASLDDVQWTEGSTNSPVTAERLPLDDPQAAKLPKDGQLWSLRLPQPTSGTVEVSSSITTPWKNRALLPLIALPEAMEQSGHVVVRCGIGGTPLLEPEGLQSIPLLPDDRDGRETSSLSSIRAAYRFNPTDCLTTPQDCHLWIGTSADSGTSTLIARQLNLESFFWPDGRATHRASFDLESYGADEFTPPLPSDARLTAVTLNGKSLHLGTPGIDGQAPAIQIQPSARSTTISVYFETQRGSLSAGNSLNPPIDENAVSFLEGEWTIWLPDEYAVDVVTRTSSDAQFNWRKRLFGPLGRPNGAAPFHPLRPADWAHIVNGIVDWQNSAPAEPKPEDLNARGKPNPAASDQRESTLPGWRAYHQSFAADGPPPVVVLHPPATTAWALTILLSSFLFGRWVHGHSGHGMIMTILLAAAAALALLLPAVFAPLAAGAVLGFLFSVIAEWPRHSYVGENGVHHSRTRIASAGALTVALMIGLTIPALGQLRDGQLPADNAASSPSIERVLIPVDTDGRPSGTKYYLSERFLRTLLASASNDVHVENGWLLTGATYTGKLPENVDGAGEWSLAFSIETLARQTTILLPLVHDEATWQPTAMLDGIPAPLSWRDNGRKCAIEIAEPGRYTLTLLCTPKTSAADGRNQINVTIPMLLAAQFQIHHPESLAGVNVRNSTLDPTAGNAPGTLSGDLNRAGHLVIEWPRLESNRSANQGLSVTELRWLHIDAMQIQLETKYIIEGGAQRPETLAIVYDSRWKPLSEAAQLVVKSRDAAPRQRTIEIPLPAAKDERQEISLRWKLLDAQVPGSLQIPPIALSSVPITQRWLAISTDPELQCAALDNTASAATEKDFLAKWGQPPADDTPQVVLANFDPSQIWSVAVRPHEAESIVHEVLNVTAGSQALRIAYQAQITPENADKFQCRLFVPANLSIDDIRLTQADRQIPLRWARDSENRINVFFSEPLSDEYRLGLSGTIPLDASGTSALPYISMSANSVAQQLRLYRDDELNVDLEGLPPADEPTAASAEPPPAQWVVRPIGVYHLDEATANHARLAVHRSHATIAGDTLTTLARDAGAWQAGFRCHFLVKDGVLDVLSLRVPFTWTGPFQIESNVPTTIETLPFDKQHQRLSVRFAAPLAKGSEIKLQIRGPLTSPAGSPVSVPDIVTTPLAGGHRYVIVPGSFDSQPIGWIEAGVHVAKLPPEFQPRAGAGQLRQLEITNDTFQVALRSRATPQPAPRIRLADTSIAAGEQGGQLIVTRLIIASDGLTDCTLQLPPDQKLLSVTLDGRPALTRVEDASRLRLMLGAAEMPQSLAITSRSTGQWPTDGASELHRPSLLTGGRPIPVEVSLWSYTNPSMATRTLIDGAAPVNALDQAALRFDRMVSIAESATAAAAGLSPDDAANWFRPWAELLDSVQNQTRRVLARPAAQSTVAQVSRSSEEQINRASERLANWRKQSSDLFAERNGLASRERYASSEPFITSPADMADARMTTYYVAEGGTDRLILEFLPSRTTSTEIQVFGLLVIVGLTAASAWLIRTPATADFFVRWPQAIGILIGLAWWAWLWPSWLGLAIAAGSLWLALRFTWPGRSLRIEGSTVLRASQCRN